MGKNGFLFKSNNALSLIETLEKFENLSEETRFKYKLNLKKRIKDFSLLAHYKKLSSFLN